MYLCYKTIIALEGDELARIAEHADLGDDDEHHKEDVEEEERGAKGAAKVELEQRHRHQRQTEVQQQTEDEHRLHQRELNLKHKQNSAYVYSRAAQQFTLECIAKAICTNVHVPANLAQECTAAVR